MLPLSPHPFATRCFLQFKRVRWTCPWKGIHIHEQSGVAAATRTTAKTTRGGEEPKPSKEMKIITRAEPSQARAESGEFPQLVAISNAIALKLHTRQSSWTRGRAAGLTWSKCSGHYICYRFRLSDKMIIKMLLSGRIIVCQGITWLQLTLGILTMLPLARCRSCCGQKNLLPTIKLSVSGRQLELN